MSENIKILHNLSNLLMKAEKDIEEIKNFANLDRIRIKYLGKKGLINKIIKLMKEKISVLDIPKVGLQINLVKNKIQKKINLQKATLKLKNIKNELKKNIDISLPGRRIQMGNLHPITSAIYRIENIFSKLGFSSVDGDEIEDSFHNFDALNIAKSHPSRNQHDTFWFDKIRLLRTQTSAVQIRVMKKKLPIRIISSGKVYRKDFDRTHTPMFHQTEGLIVDKNINFSNLKDIMYEFLKKFFKKQIEIRFRPSYFPFTEPSIEIDIKNKNQDWLEVLGCGMVHPKVLKNADINSKKYFGCAFGIGIERIVAIYYNILDIRDFFKNNLRFLKQFK